MLIATQNVIRPRPIMFADYAFEQSSKLAHYVQYYAHESYELMTLRNAPQLNSTKIFATVFDCFIRVHLLD